MNQKQKAFCDYYIQVNDVNLACKKVGYTKNTGERLLKKEEIKNYIKDNTYNKNVAKSNEVIECLTKIMRGEEESFDDKAKGVSVREKLKAAELLGKMYAIFSPKEEKTEDKPILIFGNDFIKE